MVLLPSKGGSSNGGGEAWELLPGKQGNQDCGMAISDLETWMI